MIDDRANTTDLVYAYLRERFPALHDVAADTPLLTSGAVDSLGMLDLMMFLGERFEISLDDMDFAPENLATPKQLVEFVERRVAT